MGLLRFVLDVALIPWRIAYDLFGPDDFDAFEAAQRQRFIDLHEGE